MAKVMTGVVAAYGIDGSTIAFTGVAAPATLAAGQFDPQGFGLTDEFTIDDARNNYGYTKTRTARDRKHKLTLRCLIQDAAGSPTMATALAVGRFPDMLGPVVLANFDGATTPSRINGTWNYDGGGTINGEAGGYWEVTLPLSRHGDSPAALTAVS